MIKEVTLFLGSKVMGRDILILRHDKICLIFVLVRIGTQDLVLIVHPQILVIMMGTSIAVELEPYPISIIHIRRKRLLVRQRNDNNSLIILILDNGLSNKINN